MTRLRPSSQGPRRRMNRSCFPLAKRISSYAIGPVWWNNGMSGVRTGSCESGDDKRASMASKDAYKYKYKDYCADRIKGSFWVPSWRYIVFQRKLLSLHNPQGNYKIHIDKIASCCWIRHSILDKLLCKSVTTCMNAYVLRGRDSVVRILAVQKPGGYSVDPSTLSLYT